MTSLSPLSWRKGTQSGAGEILNAIFHDRKPSTVPTGPFLSTRNSPKIADQAYFVAPMGQTCELWVCKDNSALLYLRGKATILPRVLRLDPNMRTDEWPTGFWGGLGPQRSALANALWESHAQGPALAHPVDTPTATEPPEGSFWSPYDAFPSADLRLVFPTPLGEPPAIPGDAALAITGYMASLFPDLHQGESAEFCIARRAWDPAADLAIYGPRGHGAHRLTPRKIRNLFAAIPELPQTLGAGQWMAASPARYTKTTPCLTLKVRSAGGTHSRLAAHAAWQHRLHSLRPEGR